MKKTSLNTAAAALLVAGLIGLGVAPAHADDGALDDPGQSQGQEFENIDEGQEVIEGEDTGAGDEDNVPVEAPAQPTIGFSSIGITTAQVDFGNPGTGGQVNGYIVNVTGVQSNYSMTEVLSVPGTVYLDYLAPQTSYNVSVTATGPGGSATSTSQFTTQASPVAAPGTPVIEVTEVTANSVSVSVQDADPASIDPQNPTSYNVSIAHGDDWDNVILTSAGSHTFSGLTPETEYTISVVASNVAGVSDPASRTTTTLAEKVVELPGATVLGDITVTASGADITFSSAPGGDPVDYYTVSVIPYGTEVDITQTFTEPGVASFSGLAPGLYEVRADSRNAAGGTGVAGYYFVVAAVPSIESVVVTDAGTDYILGDISANLGRSVPEVNGPVALAATKYRVTLTGGDENRTVTLGDNKGGAYFYFGDLDENTEYSVSVVAFNVAGESAASTASARTKVTPPAPVTPVAPDQDNLDNGNRGNIDAPGSVEAGDPVVVYVGSGLEGATVYGWLFSTPTALGAATVAADGTVSFTIPGNVPAGAHRIAVTSANNVLLGWDNITVTVAANTGNNGGTPADSGNGNVGGNTNGTGTTAQAVTSDQLARTGGESPLGVLLFGGLLMGLGVALVALRRKAAAVQE